MRFFSISGSNWNSTDLYLRMQGLLDHLCQQHKQIQIKLKISTVKTNFTNHNEHSIPGNCAKNLLGINTNAIGVNVQGYITSNKVMSIQDRLHRN